MTSSCRNCGSESCMALYSSIPNGALDCERRAKQRALVALAKARMFVELFAYPGEDDDLGYFTVELPDGTYKRQYAVRAASAVLAEIDNVMKVQP